MHTNAHKCTDGLGAFSGNALKQRGFPVFVQPAKLVVPAARNGKPQFLRTFHESVWPFHVRVDSCKFVLIRGSEQLRNKTFRGIGRR
jgi:hypothetical protein